MFAHVHVAQFRPAAQHLSRPREQRAGGNGAVRARRRRPIVHAILSPDRETSRTEENGNGAPKKRFAFFRQRHEGANGSADHANGNGAAGVGIDVRPAGISGGSEEQKPFYANWADRNPTEEEARGLRDKLSPQAGGWDNWGGEEAAGGRQAVDAGGAAALPSRAFLGIDEPESREDIPADSWDPVSRLLSPRREALLWTRPEWMPQFADPFDPTSDMRRWIIPYVIVPYLVSQTMRVVFLTPLFESQLEMRNPIFALKHEQEEKVEREVSAFKDHLLFEQLLGRAPPLTDTEMQATLRKKALDLEHEEREHNCEALANFVTDSTFAIILVANLLLQLDEAEKLRKTLAKEFFSLDSARQAFILLLVSDILVGYHSAEGWMTGLESIGHHYGLDERKDLIAIFVAVVPVAMDVLFKFWVFKYLRNYSPDTQVILEEIDRH